MGPGAKGVGLMISDFLDPSVTEGFPNFPDLVGAGSNLDWHVLSFVEPRWSAAFVHMWKDPVAVRVEEFRYCCDVEV